MNAVAIVYGDGSLVMCDDFTASDPQWREPTDDEKLSIASSQMVDSTPLLQQTAGEILRDILGNWDDD